MGEQLGEQLLRTALRMSWTVSLPGEVMETNADRRTATNGTWEIGYDRLKGGFEIHISSKERKNLWPFAGVGVSLLGAAALAAFSIRLRRRSSSKSTTGAMDDIQDEEAARGNTSS